MLARRVSSMRRSFGTRRRSVRQLISIAFTVAGVATASVGAAAIAASPADATNHNYNCESFWGTPTCGSANYSIYQAYSTNNYAIDYTDNGVCSQIALSGGGAYTQCTTSGYSVLLCTLGEYGWQNAQDYYGDSDNIAGDWNTNLTCSN